jgi:glycosyltransferase involved in cell wall biosynthesis
VPASLSVIIPTHRPDPLRLQRTLAGLRGQTLHATEWETLLVDNASPTPLRIEDWLAHSPANLRLLSEPRLGLTHARGRGIAEARGEILVFVDDDNVLDRGYLTLVQRLFLNEPALGAVGGPVQPEFETKPAEWVAQFHGLLALRDLGNQPLRANWRGAPPRQYPAMAPIGAGLALRREPALDYLNAIAADSRRAQLDRTGDRLVSGGDNDLVMHILEIGWSVGYEPGLRVLHLIPGGRIETAYLGRLNRAIARSWVSVLALHGIRPWRPVAPASVPFRQARAWFRARAWQGGAAWVQWQGLCGTFEGQADLHASVKATPTSPAS